MRGRSHGDWNRFHFSQILGAERVTMLLESRHPLLFVLQSTWTTPEEMLPGGVAVEVTASPETVGGRAAHVGLGSFWAATGTVGGEAHSAFAARKGRVPTSTVSVEPTVHSEPWGCYLRQRGVPCGHEIPWAKDVGTDGRQDGQSEQP